MMDKWDIAFPNLGIYLDNVPKNFTIFGVTIAFYGVIIAMGVLLGFSLVNHEGKRIGQPQDIWWDLSVPVIVSAIIGARAYYVIFQWDYYKNHLNEIVNIRKGGLAIYGAVIAGFLAMVVICRIRKQKLMQMTDVACMGLLVGQIVGRWGNFMNREIFGGYTDGLLAMRLPVEAVRQSDISADIAAHIVEGTNYIQVQPTFLYESGLNLILLLVIWFYRKHKKFEGELTWLYLGGYGIIRFYVEGIRTDQLKIRGTNIAVSQMLGVLLFIAAVIVMTVMRIRLWRSKENS